MGLTLPAQQTPSASVIQQASLATQGQRDDLGPRLHAAEYRDAATVFERLIPDDPGFGGGGAETGSNISDRVRNKHVALER